MPCADDLEEKVGALLAKRKIPKLVHHKERRRLIIVEFFQKRAVGLSGDQLVDHIHGAGK